MSSYVKIIENCKRFRKTYVGVALQEDELGVIALVANVSRPSDGIDIDCFSSHEYSVEPVERDIVTRVFGQSVDYQRNKVNDKEEEVREAEHARDVALRTLNRTLRYTLGEGFNFTIGGDINGKSSTIQQRPGRQIRPKGEQKLQ